MHRSSNYNKFFSPHVCHVCKQNQFEVNIKSQMPLKLTSCTKCCMIAYCSEQHMQLHFDDHDPICRAIVKVGTERNIWNTNVMVPDEWFAFRKKNIEYVEKELQRKLEPYEEQMFWFVKSCFICHRQLSLPTTCYHCFSVDSCHEHKMRYFAHDCLYLALAFQQNIHDIKGNYQDERMSNVYLRKIKVGISNLESYIEESVVAQRSIEEWRPKDYAYSDYLSAPLTLYFAIECAPFLQVILRRNSLIVHILAEVPVNVCALSAWEILSHLLDKNSLIIIILIGEKLQEKIIEWENCKVCRFKQKRVRFKCYSESYHNYLKYKDNVKPDIIIGYHLELEEFIVETIRAIKHQQCPLLITTKSEKKAQNNIAEIQKKLNEDIKPFLTIKNNYRSNRPYRDHENDDVFFRNNYLIIYENLNCPDIPPQKRFRSSLASLSL
ncbi:uncharacterized protein LOC116846878 [Odontomachus brunneus]|uniref:uncharacterized protein LOC116846878 n=1 Tax=Odontomachus brunneus TaxID=486640 RepID=UPI0013F1F573|nr:uncharacterized protein LOC116846878 [Odontomachus brunneus]